MAKKHKSTNISTSKELRALAVERLEQKHLSTGVPTLSNLSSPEKMLRLVHELEVHQIELEMEQEELTRTMAEAEDSLAKYTELYDFAPVGYLTLSHDSTIRQANLTSAKLLGVDRSHLLGLSLKHFVLPEDYRVIDHLIETVFTRRVSDNCEVKLLANAFQPPKVNPLLSGCTVRIEAGIKDSENACRVILFDITEQKRIETDIIESKTRLSQVLKAAYAGVWEWNLETDENIWSDEVWTLHGLTRGGEKPSFRLWADSVFPDDRENVIRAVTEAAYKAQELNVEYRVSYPDGSIHWIMARGQPLFNENGDTSRYIGTVIDTTVRKKSEQLFVEGSLKLEAALASMSDAVFISDTKGDFINYNVAFATFHRFGSKEECALTLEEYPKFLDVYLLTGEFVPLEDWVVPRALRGETGTGVEFRLLRKDSGETWIGSYNYAPLRDKDGLIVGSVVTARDVSASKVAEQKIRDYVKQLEGAMKSTLQAVAKVVEAHDPYTAGHERRVGQIAADIAQEMGWSEEKCQTMQLVGLVHDIGKMSIPGEILTKPGKLSAIEFELVKTHAENGYEILHDVEFPLPIARIIREHHERMDGSGYPHGLKGENILPESRILAVADVLEAMASNRPYRASLGIDAAISEIETHCDSLFDPVVVNATLRLFREKGYNLPD